jgi:hypothetical protein
MVHRLRVVFAVVLIVLASLLLWSNVTQAAEVTFLRVFCDSTRVRGKTEVRAPFVRITVNLASDLSVMLAEKVVPVFRFPGARFSTELDYKLQAPNTRLIISVGEWDGKRYLQPAALFGRDCIDPNATPTPTPTPLGASPTIPPVSETPPLTPFPTLSPTFTPSFVPTISRTPPPLSRTPPPTPLQTFTPTFVPTLPPTPFPTLSPTTIVTSTMWQVNSTLLEDTCGVGEDNQTFPATLVLAGDGTVLSLNVLELTFPLTNLGNGGYFGQFTVGEVSYAMDLQFISSDVFVASIGFTLASIPGCHTSYFWQGVSTG